MESMIFVSCHFTKLLSKKNKKKVFLIKRQPYESISKEESIFNYLLCVLMLVKAVLLFFVPANQTVSKGNQLLNLILLFVYPGHTVKSIQTHRESHLLHSFHTKKYWRIS